MPLLWDATPIFTIFVMHRVNFTAVIRSNSERESFGVMYRETRETEFLNSMVRSEQGSFCSDSLSQCKTKDEMWR